MRLSKPMTQIFTEIIHGKNTLQELVASLDRSVSWISEVIKDLETEGFITKNKNYTLKGSRVVIEIGNTSYATKLKELIFGFPTIKYEEILSDSKLLFLAALSEDWITIEEASKLSKVSKPMIKKYKLKLQNRGIIIKRGNLYKINDRMWRLLREFLLTYKNYAIIKGSVKWRYQNEILFEVDTPLLIRGSITGLAKYKSYGIIIGTISALCYLPEKKLSQEEIFVHSLFEVDDPRTLHLALIFYLKNKLKYKKILPISMKYGKYTMFENFVKLLKAKEDKLKLESLPTFDKKDFRRIAHMYGVKNV